MLFDQQIVVKVDKDTKAFLDSMRDGENINVSSWVREAIREKAGLTNGPLYRGKPAPKKR